MIDFKTPKYWIKNKGGGYSYPDNICDWFSKPFNHYYIYKHPILLNKFKGDIKIYEEYEIISLTDFCEKYVEEDITFSEFREYAKWACKNNIEWPEALFGTKDGSDLRFNDIKSLLKLFDNQLNNYVYAHYEILRFDSNKYNYPEWYFVKTKTIESISEDYRGIVPEFILEENENWCIHFPYDSNITAIACNDEFLIEEYFLKELEIEKIK